MIRIDPHKAAKVAPEYWRLLKIFILGKRNSSKLKAYAKTAKGYKRQLLYVDKGIVDSCSIALGNPEDIKKEYAAHFKKGSIKTGFVKRMERYYSDFFGTTIKDLDSKHPDKELKICTWLTKELGVMTCPYCNREYTIPRKLSNGREVHPEFDHFYPKSKYPYLALSLFNLVPSCHVCNHLKMEEQINVNPYFKSFEDEGLKFTLVNKLTGGRVADKVVDHWVFDLKNVEVKIKNANDNVMRLGLEEVYSGHTDVVADIVTKAQAYNESFYQSMVDSYSGLGKTPAEIYQLIWGTYMDPQEYGLRPLSKFTKDVLDEMGIK